MFLQCFLLLIKFEIVLYIVNFLEIYDNLRKSESSTKRFTFNINQKLSKYHFHLCQFIHINIYVIVKFEI